MRFDLLTRGKMRGGFVDPVSSERVLLAGIR